MRIKSGVINFFAATVVGLSFVLTGCASSPAGKIVSSPMESARTEKSNVSQAEFDRAAKFYAISVDEFSKYTIITPVSTKHLDDGVVNGSNFTSVYLQFGRGKGESAYVTSLVVSYLGKDWLFFDQMDLVSKTKDMSLDFPRNSKTENTLGNGAVGEIGAIDLTPEQERELKALIEDSGSKFRVNGSGDKIGSDFTGQFNPYMVKSLSAGFALAEGLREGLTLPTK